MFPASSQIITGKVRLLIKKYKNVNDIFSEKNIPIADDEEDEFDPLLDDDDTDDKEEELVKKAMARAAAGGNEVLYIGSLKV